MKVKAVYKKKGLNPFKLRFFDDDFYKKTVDVDDGTDMDKVKKCAVKDAMPGYELIQVEKVGG